jgi:hypothetical protein
VVPRSTNRMPYARYAALFIVSADMAVKSSVAKAQCDLPCPNILIPAFYRCDGHHKKSSMRHCRPIQRVADTAARSVTRTSSSVGTRSKAISGCMLIEGMHPSSVTFRFVVEDGTEIGRIYEDEAAHISADRWFWALWLLGQPTGKVQAHGRAATFDDAEVQFAVALKAFRKWRPRTRIPRPSDLGSTCLTCGTKCGDGHQRKLLIVDALKDLGGALC